jgi:hypothetical protein
MLFMLLATFVPAARYRQPAVASVIGWLPLPLFLPAATAMRSGCRRACTFPALQQVLLPFGRLAFDPVGGVHHHGRIHAVMEESGKPIGPPDSIITHHTREFRRVQNPDMEVRRTSLPCPVWHRQRAFHPSSA